MSCAVTLAALPPVSGATRRNLFGTMGAMLLLTAAEAGPAKATELDGELLAAFARWQPWDRERIAVESLADDDPTYDDRFTAYSGHWHARMLEIMDLPARTPEGICCKATVLRSLLQNHTGIGPYPNESVTPSEAFAWSLVNDMLGRAGA